MIQYKRFARDYHQKRKYPWRDFVHFLNELVTKYIELKGSVIDLGCANGRHFEVIKKSNNRVIGIDNSIEFLQIANDMQPSIFKVDNSYEINKIQLIQADMCFLPIRPNAINCVISVAALHHVKTEKLRTKTFREISFVLKAKGLFIFTVWRRWQKKFYSHFLKDWIKKIFCPSYRRKQKKKGLKQFGDIIIPWKYSADNITVDRFYHLYSSKELKKKLKKFTIHEFKTLGGPGGKDNFFVFCSNNSFL